MASELDNGDSSPPKLSSFPCEADDVVILRRDSKVIRSSRMRTKERTPTAIVSDAFAFLNQSMSPEFDLLDGLEEKMRLQEQGEKGCASVEDQECFNCSVNSTAQDISVCRTELSAVGSNLCAKDSGFASLERTLCGHISGNETFNEEKDNLQEEIKIPVSASTINSKLLQNCDSLQQDNRMDESINYHNSHQERTEILSEGELQENLINNERLKGTEEFDNNGKFFNKSGCVTKSVVYQGGLCNEEGPNTEQESDLKDNLKEEGANLHIKINNVNLDQSHQKENAMTEVSTGKTEEMNIASEGNVGKLFEKTIPEFEDRSPRQESDTKDHHARSCNGPEAVRSCLSEKSAEEGTSFIGCSDNSEEGVIVNSVNSGQVSKGKQSDEELNRDVQEPAEDLSASVLCDTPETCDRTMTRRRRIEKNPSTEIGSDDSSDEETGIYAESFRRSNWIRVSREGKLELRVPTPPVSRSSDSSSLSSEAMAPKLPISEIGNENIDHGTPFSPQPDDVFIDPVPEATSLIHKRSDSVTTTASESEFKNRYVSRRKCLIQRADSQQEYHRLSARIYDQDKMVVVDRIAGCNDLGLHLLDSHPAFITSVDPGSAAHKAGISEGQILVSVNDQNVLTTDHSDIVKLIQTSQGSIRLGVANSDFQPVRDLQASVMSGFMYKLGNTSLVRMWKKRYFALRQDNCLYYYKNDQEHDPLGAIPLGGYTISRHTDTSKDYCFKAEKYGARTYYFMTDNRDQLTEWVGALTEAVARSKKRKESFLSVSSHNVSLPALDIRRPECSGYLGKLSPNRLSWCRRYCVLKDACIYYYKDVNSLNALGVAHLHGYRVDAENLPRKKVSFSLQPPEPKMRVFCFSADNETDKKRWVEALIHSIQRWVRVEKEAECKA